MIKKISVASVATYVMMALAMPVLAQTSTSTPATSTPATTTPPVVKGKKRVDLVCMQNAVVKRDDSVLKGLDSYYAAAKAALTARKDALKSAWGIEDAKARKEALRAAWKNYREAIRKARHDFRSVKRDAWKQFKEDRRICRGSGEGDESEGADEQL